MTGHLRPEDAGRLASEAGVGRLLLTHYFVEYGVDQLLAAAAEEYTGPIDVAQEGEWYA
jgi:ribonuclease BN (tRNA processing enzyme)